VEQQKVSVRIGVQLKNDASATTGTLTLAKKTLEEAERKTRKPPVC
jgi:hypothetical protein